ncbi:MAG: site-specific integrase [candidate division Zixibacteria bacterium]|nr:site-specific integrase [candidate division Zixibacteria bacterium]
MTLRIVRVFSLLKGRKRESGNVFCRCNGKVVTCFKEAFNCAKKRARIEDFRFHDLRHTFASYMAMNGVDLLTLKELLGHKDIRMTMRYSHLSPDFKKNAIERLQFTDSHKSVTLRTNHLRSFQVSH